MSVTMTIIDISVRKILKQNKTKTPVNQHHTFSHTMYYVLFYEGLKLIKLVMMIISAFCWLDGADVCGLPPRCGWKPGL